MLFFCCSFRSLLERPLASLLVFVADLLTDFWLFCFVLINGLHVFCFSNTNHAVLDFLFFLTKPGPDWLVPQKRPGNQTGSRLNVKAPPLAPPPSPPSPLPHHCRMIQNGGLHVELWPFLVFNFSKRFNVTILSRCAARSLSRCAPSASAGIAKRIELCLPQISVSLHWKLQNKYCESQKLSGNFKTNTHQCCASYMQYRQYTNDEGALLLHNPHSPACRFGRGMYFFN